jgi:hypothetical protein
MAHRTSPTASLSCYFIGIFSIPPIFIYNQYSDAYALPSTPMNTLPPDPHPLLDHDDTPPVVTTAGFVAFTLACFALAVFYTKSEQRFVPILDHANLAFHEAGHLFFRILGPTMELYGGTLGQLVFPIVVSVSFWRRGAALAGALGVVWLMQNFLNIARYMADARAQVLPLVGGGEHDWAHILSRWGAISADTLLAGRLSALAWFGVIITWGIVAQAWLRARA